MIVEGTAWRGATGPSMQATTIRHHVENHLAWIRLNQVIIIINHFHLNSPISLVCNARFLEILNCYGFEYILS